VDEYAAAVLSFPGDIVAEVATGVRLGLENVARVFGTEGSILMRNPWGASRGEPEPGLITVWGAHAREIKVPADRTSFAYEADVVAAAVGNGQQQPDAPAMTWDDTLGNLATLDAWRAELGLDYDAERPGHSPTTVANRPLAARPGHTMSYGTVPGLTKQVSRLIMGCDNQLTYPQAEILFDAWLECGGNAFDTSWVYGGGRQEVLLGQWIKARGVQDDVVVTVKGAHTPRCTPELLIQDFHTSLDRLQLAKTDLYIMHRDNPEVPIDEFVDALNELKAQGRVDAFGGSNWSFERLDAANAYARQAEKQGMGILNNNLSLAHMVREVWSGCVHVSDPDSRARLERDQTVVFAWSSQARGYFLPDDSWQKLGADNFTCWDSEENRIRRQRAFELARAKGVSALNIAAAYVLCQPFPVFALIGPRNVTELATCLPGLELELGTAERAYLSLESDQKPQGLRCTRNRTVD
jgi:aryl-alcohol dehydrogenase-like predicted oxidoreductase